MDLNRIDHLVILGNNRRSETAWWESTVHFPSACLSPACFKKRETYYIYWKKIAFSLKINNKKRIKLKGMSLGLKPSANESVLKHIIIVGHGKCHTQHSSFACLLCVPLKDQICHSWKSSSRLPYHANRLSIACPRPLALLLQWLFS